MKKNKLTIYFLLGTIVMISVACHSTQQTKKSESFTFSFTTDAEPDTTDSEEYNVLIETQPKLIGGIQRLQDKVRYPNEAKERNITGIVRLRFIVKKDGKLGEVTVVQSPHPLLSRAAKRALNKMRFIPGKQNGEPADVYMTLPIFFTLR